MDEKIKEQIEALKIEIEKLSEKHNKSQKVLQKEIFQTLIKKREQLHELQKSYDPEYNILGKRLKERREQTDLSQVAVSREIGINQMSIVNYETGKRFPDAKILRKFAQFYGCSTDYLLGLSDFVNNSDKLLYLSQLESLEIDLEKLVDGKNDLLRVFSTIYEGYACLSDYDKDVSDNYISKLLLAALTLSLCCRDASIIAEIVCHNAIGLDEAPFYKLSVADTFNNARKEMFDNISLLIDGIEKATFDKLLERFPDSEKTKKKLEEKRKKL